MTMQMDMQIADFFSREGVLAQCIDGYTVRDGQVAMAQAIGNVIASEEADAALFCEAGTGVGKSFAYLLPVLLSEGGCIISTATHTLQYQLFHKDLQLLRELLPQPLQVILLKGRSNYLCLHHWENFIQREKATLSAGQLAVVSEIDQWREDTRDGDLSEAGVLAEESRLRPKITSTVENCLGSECRFYENCFVYKVRRQAKEADIVITNHNLVLADIKLDAATSILPKVDVMIFDEAHSLPDIAAQQFGSFLSSNMLVQLLEDTSSHCDQEGIDMQNWGKLRSAYTEVVAQIGSMLSPQKADVVSQRYSWRELVLQRQEIRQELQSLQQLQAEVMAALEQLQENTVELEQCALRCRTQQEQLAMFLQTEQEKEGEQVVRWVEGKQKNFTLHITPLDISTQFRAGLQKYEATPVFTSATLVAGTDVSFFARQLGYPESCCEQFSSPFDLQQQALLYLPEDLPDPQAADFLRHFHERCCELLQHSGGRAFILCTSHRTVNWLAARLAGNIEYPLLVQGQAARQELLQRFLDAPDAVLVATSSFWSGVDVRGDDLSLVIIEKLPFASHQDPIMRAREESMKQQGRSLFRDYQIPQAVITLKQGAGRLIRDATDYGVCAICDRRITKRHYGQFFRKALAEWPVTNSLEKVAQFFAQHK